MHLSVILDMAANTFGERTVFSDGQGSLTARQLHSCAYSLAEYLGLDGGDRVVWLGQNSRAFPVTLFAAAVSGSSFVPLNYRLTDEALRDVARRAAPATAIVDDDMIDRLEGVDGLRIVGACRVPVKAAVTAGSGVAIPRSDPDEIGVLLFTSGTSGDPKISVLRHSHLAMYPIATIDFGGAAESDVSLVSMPPYHIAGIAGVVSGLYSLRRSVYIRDTSPEAWIEAVDSHGVTHAMVVPTMLGRVLDVLENREDRAPTLRHLSYGGGRMPPDVIERALAMLPQVSFVNAYGLTETSSTIAILGPQDHRDAISSPDPVHRRRLTSVGRPHHAVEVSIRDETGEPVPDGSRGEIWVRGEQVSGEYLGGAPAGLGGWFKTRDEGWLDDGGYLFVEGRLDDVIVRGGENISPGEVESVLRSHPDVADVAVFGVPSEEWGETVAAAVVLVVDAEENPDTLRAFSRERLRSTRTPEVIYFRTALPYNDTGKVLRRELRRDPSGSSESRRP